MTLGAQQSHLPRPRAPSPDCPDLPTASTEQPLPSTSLHIPPRPSTSLHVPLHPLPESSGRGQDHSGDTFPSMSHRSHPLGWLCAASQTGGCLSLMPGHHPAQLGIILHSWASSCTSQAWPHGNAGLCWGGHWVCCDSWGGTQPLSEHPACSKACAATGFLDFQLSNLLDWSWEMQEIRFSRR